MRNFIKSRSNRDSRVRDRADSVLTTFILAVPLIALLCGMTIDVSKNIYLKGLYDQQAQTAAEAAVKSIDARGSLGNSAIAKFQKEFELQSGSAANSKTGKNIATSENETYEGGACERVDITLDDGTVKKNVKMPYYRLTLSTERGKSGTKSKTIEIINGNITDKTFGLKGADANKYKVISADVYTASQNMVLGMAGSLFGSDDLNCQVYKSSVSAIAFGSNQDL